LQTQKERFGDEKQWKWGSRGRPEKTPQGLHPEEKPAQEKNCKQIVIFLQII